MSSRTVITQPTLVRRGRSGVIALWVAQTALAGMFLLAGGSKLVGAPAMVTLFNAIGVGQWFRYVTGLIEVVLQLRCWSPPSPCSVRWYSSRR